MEREDGEVFHFGSVCATRHTGRDSGTLRAEAREVAAVKQTAANVEFKATAAHQAYEARLAEAHRLRIEPGRTFANFVRAEAIASQIDASVIAEKHGVNGISV